MISLSHQKKVSGEVNVHRNICKDVACTEKKQKVLKRKKLPTNDDQMRSKYNS
jgi:hypothetical protein